MLDSSVTYQWIKYNDMEMQPVAKSGSLLFSSLNLSNSGNYSCDVVVSSSYLNNNITATSALVSIRLRGKIIRVTIMRNNYCYWYTLHSSFSKICHAYVTY